MHGYFAKSLYGNTDIKENILIFLFYTRIISYAFNNICDLYMAIFQHMYSKTGIFIIFFSWNIRVSTQGCLDISMYRSSDMDSLAWHGIRAWESKNIRVIYTVILQHSCYKTRRLQTFGNQKFNHHASNTVIPQLPCFDTGRFCNICVLKHRNWGITVFWKKAI